MKSSSVVPRHCRASCCASELSSSFVVKFGVEVRPSFVPRHDAGLLAMLLMAALARPSLDVWYGPNPFQHTTSLRSGHSRDLRARPDFYPNVLQPAMSWPDLAKRTGVFKIFLDMLYTGISTDAQLIGLIGVVQQQGLRTGIEVGGARCGARAAAISPPPSPTLEQRDVARWLSLGGRIDSLSTDHADVWNVRGGSGPLCEPPIPMADRIEVVAQVFAS